MKRLLLLLPLALLAACSEGNTALPTSETSVTNVGGPNATSAIIVYDTTSSHGGNVSCTQLGYAYGFKLAQNGMAVNGTWTVGNMGTITVTSADGITFNWTSTFGIDAVASKGGAATKIYKYNPESYGDTGLTPPDNASGGPAAISHADFCFDPELGVTKTAATTYTRTWTWAIDKSASASSLLLSNGQAAPAVNYAVDATSTSVDSDWNANGTITIYNPAPFATNVASVTDLMTGGFAGTVNCGGLPASVASGASLTCTYSGALPDASSRVNTATASTDGTTGGVNSTDDNGNIYYGSGPVGDGSGTANVTFGAPTTLTDESISVTDSRTGNLGTATGSGHWTYNIVFGPYATCGDRDEGNTASFTTNDTGAQGSDSWNVHVSVTGCDNGGGGPPPPSNGCTLTQGYWKNHSLAGPARYDDAWLNLGASQQNTIFFNSGMTWLTVFRTAPAGNKYYNLADQWMAAKLNQLNGASSTAAVTAAMTQAQTIFAATSGTNLSKANATLATSLAATLDAYNNGVTGPGHCSE